MRDEAISDEHDSGEIEDLAPAAARMSGRKLVLFIVLPLVLVLGLGAGIYFGGLMGSGGDAEKTAADDGAQVRQAIYYDLPELLVNLNAPRRKTNYLKLKVSLELRNPEDIQRLEKVLPRIIDNFQVYLRELRIEDLRGSAGIYRLREELLMRVNAAAQPATIHDVLFKEMLVQ